MQGMPRQQAMQLLREYNKEPFHLLHALTVEGVMRYYARELGYAEQEDFYDWDRELAHFLQIYPDIAGLVIGRFPKEEGMTEEILHFILDKYPHLKTIPVVYDVDFGHTQPIFTFPLGGQAEISTQPLRIEILEG